MSHNRFSLGRGSIFPVTSFLILLYLPISILSLCALHLSFVIALLYRLFSKALLHGAIYRPDSFVLMLRYCANLKTIRYESTTLNRIVADKSHRVIVA